MPRCPGTKRDGGQCTTIVKPPHIHCYQHDPSRADERRRNASRAGKRTGGRAVQDLKRRISEVIEDVLKGTLDRGRAAVAIQGFNSLRGVLEVERKIREVDDWRRASRPWRASRNKLGGPRGELKASSQVLTAMRGRSRRPRLSRKCIRVSRNSTSAV